MSAPTKELIIGMLDRWIRQRPGLEAANYFGGGDYRENLSNYRSEVRRIGRQLSDARTLLRQVELSGITAEELAAAFPRAFSGRLTLEQRADGKWALSYCTGQYWPTEYRAAAAAVLASALWSYKRDRCMPSAIVENGEMFYPHAGGFRNLTTAGGWLRASFRREFGRAMQSRYFD